MVSLLGRLAQLSSLLFNRQSVIGILTILHCGIIKPIKIYFETVILNLVLFLQIILNANQWVTLVIVVNSMVDTAIPIAQMCNLDISCRMCRPL